MSSRSAGARELIGVPLVPPARLSGAAVGIRRLLGGAHRSMAPPPVRVLENLFGLLDHSALVALVELGIPDALTTRLTVAELAARVGARPDPLERLARYAAGRGWLAIDRRGRLRPNKATAFLRRDHPGGWHAWVKFMAGQDVHAAVSELSAVVRSGEDAFTRANGLSFFEWTAAHPDRGAAFDGAMSAGGRMHGLALARALDWSTSHRVCDVGGGVGALLRVLLEQHPHLDGVVLDLPEVIERSTPGDRLDLRSGDAFRSVPDDCDTYLLVNVIHDWGDEDAVRLLQRVALDSHLGTRVVVVESHRSTGASTDLFSSIDLLMMAVAPGGRERTLDEIVRLGERAGLRFDRAVPLASGDFAHVFTRE